MTPLLVFALAVTASGPAATTVAYRVDASLMQIDRFRRPAVLAPMIKSEAASRALGLGKLRLALDVQAGESGLMSLVLRPDAANRTPDIGGGQAFEIDTRTGKSYQPMPTVRLLDAYQFHLLRGSSLGLAAGVWEELTETRLSYPNLLAFGLTAQLPAKFSGGRLRWQPHGEEARDFGVDLYVFQGDEDRTEVVDRGDTSLDEAPLARDPHQTSAVVGDWGVSKNLRLGFVLGFGDSAELGGRRSEQFGQFTGRWLQRIREHEVIVSWDGRRVMEQWRMELVKVAPRVQQSLSLTSSFSIVPQHWALMGVHLGTSQHAKDDQTPGELRSYQGWQGDIGYQAQLGQGFTVTLLLNQERRRMTTTGESERGGILDGTVDRSMVRRMGLQLDYLLHGNT